MTQVQNLLKDLQDTQSLRKLSSLCHDGFYVWHCGHKLLNLSSNDYLGIATQGVLEKEFLYSFAKNSLDDELFLNDEPKSDRDHSLRLGSSSSRSISGNFSAHEALELYLGRSYGWGKKALLFNSGYQMNIGLISSLAKLKDCLFLVDKQAHASIYDGLKLGGAKFIRYAHSDLYALTKLVTANTKKYNSIFIITEALFSMDGDICNIAALTRLKRRYKNIYLYIDEAHSVGAMGERGLGLSYSGEYAKDIDFVCFTFGKAIAAAGAAVLCSDEMRSFFINKARSFIYSTAMPPFLAAYINFSLRKIADMSDARSELAALSLKLKSELEKIGARVLGQSYILSIIAGSNAAALGLCERLQKAGYFAPAIRPPSVAANSARIRLGLSYGMSLSWFEKFLDEIAIWLKYHPAARLDAGIGDILQKGKE